MRRQEGSWNYAIQWSAEELLIAEARVTILGQAAKSVELYPDDQILRGAVMFLIDKHLGDVWGLSGSSSPFAKLAREAVRAAAADLKRDFADVDYE